MLSKNMDNDTFFNYKMATKRIMDIADEKLDYTRELYKKEIFKKYEHFSTIEKPSTNIGFISKGLVRIYITDYYGDEATLNFRGENSYTASYGGVILNNQQPVNIQALEDAVIYTLPRDEFVKLWETDPIWKDFLQLITEYDSLQLRKREISFLVDDAKTRYINFLNTFHSLAGRIKLRYVSSYLGISQETLSRIRSSPSYQKKLKI